MRVFGGMRNRQVDAASNRRGERLALFDDIGNRENRGLVAVLAAMGHACGNLESIPRSEGVRASAVDAQFQPAFDNIAGFNPRMSKGALPGFCPPKPKRDVETNCKVGRNLIVRTTARSY
jgi:hypothetical protein